MARCQPLSPDAIDDNTPVRTHADRHNRTQSHAQEGEEVDTIHSRSHLVPHSRKNSDDNIRQLAVDDRTDGRSGDGSSHHRSHDDMSTACFLSEMLPLLRDADKEKENTEKENKEKENTSLHGAKQTPVLETKNSAPLSSSSPSVTVVLSEGNLPTPPFDEAVSATTLSSLPPTPVWMATSTPTSPSAKTYSNSTGARIATAIPSPATLAARALASSTSSRRNRNRNRTRTPLAPAAMVENYNEEDIVGGDDVSTDVMMRMQSSSLPLQQQEEEKRKKEAKENLRHGNDDNSARGQAPRPSGSDGSLRRGDDSDNNNINQSTPLDSQCSRKELSGDVEGSMNHLSSFSSSSSSSTTAVAAATDNVLDEWQPNIDDCTPGQGRTLFLRTRDGRLITISTTRPVPRRVADVRALVDSFFKTPGGGNSGNLPGNMTRSTETSGDTGTHPTNEK